LSKKSIGGIAEALNRQFRRRIEREWGKIRLGKSCTRFVEQNDLYSIPYVLYFQAVKVGEDLMCVYNVSMFEHKEGSGHLKSVHVCQFANSLFRSLSLIELGLVLDKEIGEGEEYDHSV
jgi:hypothetical protein